MKRGNGRCFWPEEKLLASVKKRPYDIRLHKKLSEYYLINGNFLRAEQEQEILEYLSRIKRMINAG